MEDAPCLQGVFYGSPPTRKKRPSALNSIRCINGQADEWPSDGAICQPTHFRNAPLLRAQVENRRANQRVKSNHTNSSKSITYSHISVHSLTSQILATGSEGSVLAGVQSRQSLLHA